MTVTPIVLMLLHAAESVHSASQQVISVAVVAVVKYLCRVTAKNVRPARLIKPSDCSG
jgi:hypothetical protein